MCLGSWNLTEAWQERIREARLLYRDGDRVRSTTSAGGRTGPNSPCCRPTNKTPSWAASQGPALTAVEGSLAEADERVDEKESLGGAPPSNQPVTTDGLGFFHTLVLHVRQSFYADPVYGGNRDGVGWKVIGYPGPPSVGQVLQRTYTTIAYPAEDETWDGSQRCKRALRNTNPTPSISASWARVRPGAQRRKSWRKGA